jgi:hypothetical protein
MQPASTECYEECCEVEASGTPVRDFSGEEQQVVLSQSSWDGCFSKNDNQLVDLVLFTSGMARTGACSHVVFFRWMTITSSSMLWMRCMSLAPAGFCGAILPNVPCPTRALTITKHCSTKTQVF